MIVVDASVWIHFFNGKRCPQTQFLLKNLDKQLIVLGDIILCEVLQGFKHESDFNKAKKALSVFPVEPVCHPGNAIWAAEHYRSLRKKGLTIRKTINCLIATFCLENDYYLLHDDKDFEPFVAHLGLKSCLNHGLYHH